MRSLATIACMFVVALLSMNPAMTPSAFGAEPEWVLVDENGDSSFFYDKSATSKKLEGRLQVTTRVVYTEEGKADALKILAAKNMRKLYETRYLHDLNCADRESRLLKATHLDKKGGILRSTDLASSTEWEAIPPDVRIGSVAEEVCAE